MTELTHHTTPQKKEMVKKIVELLQTYPIVGAVNMENLPTPQLQRMKAQLRGKIVLVMTKKRLILKAVDEVKASKKGISGIKEYLKGMPALLFTKENPFSLFKIIKKSKSQAPAKAGQTAPKDLVIPAGPTPFAPGPIIGELGSLGIKAGVEGGKVAVKEDKIICKEGETVSEKVAGLLTRFGIEPMEAGLDLIAVYEKEVIYQKKILDIDESKFMQELITAISEAKNLAIEAAYVNVDTVEDLIAKAFREAKAVALESNILSDATVEELLSKAEKEVLALKEVVGELKIPEKEPSKKGSTEVEKKAELEVEPEKPEQKKKVELEKQKVYKKPEPAEKPREHEKTEKKEEKPVPKMEEQKVGKAEGIVKPVEDIATKLVEKKYEPLMKPVEDIIKKEEEKREKIQKDIREEKDIVKKAEKIYEQLHKKAIATGRPVTERFIQEVKEEPDPEKEKIQKEQKDKKEQGEVEKLTQELVKKGTLRKEGKRK